MLQEDHNCSDGNLCCRANFCFRLPLQKLGGNEKAQTIRTQARSCTILPTFVGMKFEVHNGKDYQELQITEDMVGYKLGQFVPYVFL